MIGLPRNVTQQQGIVCSTSVTTEVCVYTSMSMTVLFVKDVIPHGTETTVVQPTVVISFLAIMVIAIYMTHMTHNMTLMDHLAHNSTAHAVIAIRDGLDWNAI